MLFHGAFKDKSAAEQKERATPGSFIRSRYIRGEKRYVVMSPKTTKKNSLLGKLLKRAAKSAVKRAKSAIFAPRKRTTGAKRPRRISWDSLTRGDRFKLSKDAGLAPSIAQKISSMSWAALGRSTYRGWRESLGLKLRQLQGAELANPRADIRIKRGIGTSLIYPLTARGKRWTRIHVHYTHQQVQKDGGIVVDTRTIGDIANLAETFGLTVEGENPRRGKKRKRNSEALEGERKMYSKFHGRKPKTVRKIFEVQDYQQDFAQLGKLVKLVFKTPAGKFEIAFTDQDKVELATNAEGTQLYFIGGCQDVSSYLKQWNVDSTKDLVDLGPCTLIEYRTEKKFDRFHPINYYHKLGEESGVRPRLMFNQLSKRLALVGGEYEVKEEGIIN